MMNISRAGDSILLILPILTQREGDRDEPWIRRAKRFRQHWSAAFWGGLLVLHRWHPAFPVLVTLIRVAPDPMPPEDVPGSLRAVRDGLVCGLLDGGADAGSHLLSMAYAQRPSAVDDACVQVQLAPMTPP